MRRILIPVAMLALAGCDATRAAESPWTPGPESRRPVVVEVAADSVARRELVAWAVGRFRLAGLTLPPLQVRYHADTTGCAGFYGLYRGVVDGRHHIDMCTPSELHLLHELAHAWAANGVTDEVRAAFLGVRGLEAWSGEDVAWGDRGSEHAASILAWGVADRDFAIPSTTAGDTHESLVAAFEVLTGRPPLQDGAG